MERKMSSSRQKWREGFQKSKTQKSIDFSRRKSSLFEDETSDQELQEYLESLKKKSGIKRLWSGDRFDKTVRDEEDKTPDISISSSDYDLGDKDLEDIHSMPEKEDDSDSDFRPNLVMLTDSPKDDDNEDIGGSLFHGVQLADFEISDDEDKQTLNNDTPSKSISEPKDIKNVLNNLNLASDIETEDDGIAEEIEDDIDEVLPSFARNKTPENTRSNDVQNTVHSSPSETPRGQRSQNRHRSQSRSNASLEHSYTLDFSTADENSIIEEKTESSYRSKSSQASSSRRSSISSRSSKSGRSSRSKRHSKSYTRSGYTSSSSLASDSNHESSQISRTKKNKEIRDKNIHLCDASVQTGLDLGLPPAGFAVGMATVNQKLGMQYVDPSPIATHVVSPEALEAITAYNPAVIALTDMLKQQIRLVEQFVNANTRMYQAYTSNLNSQYRYTTLEETLEFIKANRPNTISMKDALKQVKKEES